MPQQLQILSSQRNRKGARKLGFIPFETPTHALLSNTALSILHAPSLSTRAVASHQCAQLCAHVFSVRRGKERSCQKVMAIAALVFALVTWMFCIVSMHLSDGSASYIRNSTHIRFHGLSYCCSVGKF